MGWRGEKKVCYLSCHILYNPKRFALQTKLKHLSAQTLYLHTPIPNTLLTVLAVVWYMFRLHSRKPIGVMNNSTNRKSIISVSLISIQHKNFVFCMLYLYRIVYQEYRNLIIARYPLKQVVWLLWYELYTMVNILWYSQQTWDVG